MYVLGVLNFSRHFGATIAGPCRSHFPICMLILRYQYLCLITSTSFCMSYIIQDGTEVLHCFCKHTCSSIMV